MVYLGARPKPRCAHSIHPYAKRLALVSISGTTSLQNKQKRLNHVKDYVLFTLE